MTGTKNLWTDPRSGIFYLRRKVPVALRASFNCGEFYKVSLGTSGLRVAEKKFAIANGEYEAKLATFRAALAGQHRSVSGCRWMKGGGHVRPYDPRSPRN